jgi:prevent-host-death family protein
VIHIKDIRSLTDFNRNTKAHLKRLEQTGRPEVLTVNGRAKLVVQSAGAYERLIKEVGRRISNRRKG